MLCEGVLVVAKDVNLKTGFCSGTRIGDWVLTHGTILIPFFDNKEDAAVCSEYNLRKKSKNIIVSDYIKNSELADIQSLIFTVITGNTYSKNFRDLNETDRPGLSHKAKVEKLFQCTTFRDSLNSATMSWELDTLDKETELSVSVPLVISTLLLLKLIPSDANETRGLTESLLMATESIHIYRGMEILVESTPFNTLSFFNSWSCGIVSNLLGPTSSVLLLDARLTIGCEGAPIFICDHGKKGSLIGIVMKSMTWLSGEWIGFSLGLTLQDIIHSLDLKVAITNSPLYLHDEDSILNYIGILDAAIVRVSCGHKWGSGVVVDAADGIILTCAHVVIEGKEVLVEVQRRDSVESIVAKVLYATPYGMPYDIAVISLGTNKNLKQLPVADKPPCKGEKVFSVGYSYFSKCMFGAAKVTISHGIISGVLPDGPVHTSCWVHSGQSGGALIRPPCQLLALIVSNAKNDDIVFPEYSFTVSYECFLEPLKAFIDSKDIKKLYSLTNTNSEVRRKWNFTHNSKL